jgi:hypothetical protein
LPACRFTSRGWQAGFVVPPRKDTCNFILGLPLNETKMVWFIENEPESTYKNNLLSSTP